MTNSGSSRSSDWAERITTLPTAPTLRLAASAAFGALSQGSSLDLLARSLD